MLNVATGQGGSRNALTKGMVANFQVPIPPLAEQKAIAEALSDVDALIAAQEELIEKKRAIKQGAMQELLTGKKRLPGFGGKWIEKRLGDCATMFAGGTPSSKIEGYYGGDIPWVSISDISIAGKYIERTAETLSDAGLNNSSAKWYPPNALLFAMYASIGKCCIAKERMTSSQAILGIYDLIDIDVEFLYYLLTFRNDEFLMMGQTGTQSNLSKAIVEEIVINTPSLAEQKAIAEVLSDMDAEIEALEAKRAKYESIKQGMMQELLTGRTRLEA
jgi:type I restriction enzyme S subunit